VVSQPTKGCFADEIIKAQNRTVQRHSLLGSFGSPEERAKLAKKLSLAYQNCQAKLYTNDTQTTCSWKKYGIFNPRR
jgi:hypothetical protein